MFPVSVCEGEGLDLSCLLLEMKQNCLSEMIRLFGMLFSPFSIREAVLIHSENLMKNSPVSSTHLLNAHPTNKVEDSESIIEHLYRKLPAEYSLFVFH